MSVILGGDIVKAHFYKTESDNIIVNKELTPINIDGQAYVNVVFKDVENKGTPTMEVAYHEPLMHANYCYIEEFGYYYNLSEPVLAGQRIIFSYKTDLLMSKKDEILQLYCIIARQEKKFNAYLKDDRYPVKAKQDVTTVLFPSGFSDSHQEIIIAVNGGGGN